MYIFKIYLCICMDYKLVIIMNQTICFGCLIMAQNIQELEFLCVSVFIYLLLLFKVHVCQLGCIYPIKFKHYTKLNCF